MGQIYPIFLASVLTAVFGLVANLIYQRVRESEERNSNKRLLLGLLEQLSILVDRLKETDPSVYFDLKIISDIINNITRVENCIIQIAIKDYSFASKLLQKLAKISNVITEINLLELYPYIGVTATGSKTTNYDMFRELRSIELELMKNGVYLDKKLNPKIVGGTKKEQKSKEQSAQHVLGTITQLIQSTNDRDQQNIQRRRDLLSKLTDISMEIAEIKRSIKQDNYCKIETILK